ncbi:MAG: 16S rRNA (uracil(1498)-N(3))-methyltransferase [Lachnospiraceae bacterium]|nr:16S rRNA (uracil(1498)-N(3))-methyltransferase [Lachnospiraceae bacterium]
MYQFFVEDEQVQAQEKIMITGSDVNHIKNVLRMRAGERVRISDASGKAYFCHLEEVRDDAVVATIDQVDERGTELGNKIILFQGLPKGDKMELIIQKATELGISEIYPVAMKNCVVKLDDKKAQSKVTRWQTIAESAAKQSKRTVIPKVQMPVTWKKALDLASAMDVKLVPYENERGMEATRETIRGIKKGQTVAIFVGPEGGFSPEEIDLPEEYKRISLGRRILRTETAGFATLSMLVYELEE